MVKTDFKQGKQLNGANTKKSNLVEGEGKESKVLVELCVLLKRDRKLNGTITAGLCEI